MGARELELVKRAVQEMVLGKEQEQEQEQQGEEAQEQEQEQGAESGHAVTPRKSHP